MSSEREKLIGEVLMACREMSTETVMFHAAIADKRGLSATESKATDYLARFGPLTPKDLVKHSGLAPASVTALIDRLERKGLVRRKPHPEDRRKVLIELDQPDDASPWEYLIEQMLRFLDRYSDEQLRLIVEFTRAGSEITHRATKRLTGN
ncbi:MAG TPA: MarR family transcriptional regulator [Amycolatopsis sp.]|uniref:MarR family winged helix-turn-helix transcriptional regulator n=1 Tax=Amycolatopsis sp. TaxID=37632 RepID=UPI002B493B86|nr:MarR family transcriptional regulator [Amycolatopsis sp.]HKS45464.1 MarR family transcriptional regulator [Amycolatopsis sp.]